MLFLFLLFCLDCKVWNRAKINYPFIFEFDARHSLDWHQLSEVRLDLLGTLPMTNPLTSAAPLSTTLLTWPLHLAQFSTRRGSSDVHLLASNSNWTLHHHPVLPWSHVVS